MRHLISIFWFLPMSLLCNSPSMAQSDGIQSFFDCADCPEMVMVPAGEVQIGSYETEAYRRGGERPKQQLVISNPFAMSKHEVTVGQFRAFIAETRHEITIPYRDGQPLKGCNYYDGKGYGYVANHSWDNVGFPQREDEPVVCVSYSDAKAFTDWLSKKSGRSYAVPSTTQFEYAVRAGANTPWSWGTDPAKACDHGNIADETFARDYPKRSSFNCDDGYKYLARVGRFEANSFGLHDLFGNAWEWTRDCWHDDLTDAPLDGSSWGSEDDGKCEYRVPKGGGWISGPAWARASVRSRDGEHYRSFMLGFRVVREEE